MVLQLKSKASINSNIFFTRTHLTTDIKYTYNVTGSLEYLRNWGSTGLISFLVHSRVYIFV